MNDVRKALIWGIENPPREYTIEEWHIISEFARHVAEHSKESLKEDLKKAMEKPCVTSDTEFEENMKKEYEQLQRGMKEFAKGKIGINGEVPPSISIEDIKNIDCVECNLDFKCNECKYRECEASEYPCNECEKSSKFEKRKTK